MLKEMKKTWKTAKVLSKAWFGGMVKGYIYGLKVMLPVMGVFSVVVIGITSWMNRNEFGND